MRPQLALTLRGFLALATAASALGCSQKDATKCQEALDGTRKSIAAADNNLISQWRNRAYTYCADRGSLTTLDRQIVDQQAADAAAKAAVAQRKAQNDGLITAFTGWAGQNRTTPDHASATPKCDGDDPTKPAATEPKAKERMCTATRLAPPYTLTARYWDADHTAVLFMTTPPGPISCDDLGPNKVLKQWGVPSQSGPEIKRTRCELSSGALSGMNAVVSEAGDAPVYIFTPAYLEKDPSVKKIAGE